MSAVLADNKANALLHQMGYYREETCFCSLNLTPEQFDVLGRANLVGDPNWSTEELITRALEFWMQAKTKGAV